MAWGDDLKSHCPIRAWEPHRRLQTGWFDSGEAHSYDARPLASIVDRYIEGRDGKTVLRLVHSGIGDGAAWDEEYESLGRGWSIELRNFKHYPEHHAGERRRAVWVRQPIAIPVADAWRRLAGPDGVIVSGSLGGAVVGERYALELSGGDALRGSVTVHNPQQDFVGTVDNLGNSIFRVSIERCFATPEVGLWLFAWSGIGAAPALLLLPGAGACAPSRPGGSYGTLMLSDLQTAGMPC